MLCFRRMWQTSGLWTKKAVERCRWGSMSHPSRSMEDRPMKLLELGFELKMALQAHISECLVPSWQNYWEGLACLWEWPRTCPQPVPISASNVFLLCLLPQAVPTQLLHRARSACYCRALSRWSWTELWNQMHSSTSSLGHCVLSQQQKSKQDMVPLAVLQPTHLPRLPEELHAPLKGAFLPQSAGPNL